MHTRKAYVYTITNIKTEKQYVGITINIKRRKRDHFTALKMDKHYNSHLQHDFNKYDRDKFKFVVIEETTENKVYKREKFWIKKLNSFRNGYNFNLGGKGAKLDEEHPWLGKQLPQYMKDKISKTVSKSISGEKHPFYEKHHSEETKKKISKTLKGKSLNELHDDNCQCAFCSSKISEKARKRSKEVMTGESNHNVHFSKKDAIEIRQKYLDNDVIYKDLANEYNICEGTIGRIVRCEHWATKHLREE